VRGSPTITISIKLTVDRELMHVMLNLIATNTSSLVERDPAPSP